MLIPYFTLCPFKCLHYTVTFMLLCIYILVVYKQMIPIAAYRYTDAAAFLLRLGVAADKCNATNSQCKVETLFSFSFKKRKRKYFWFFPMFNLFNVVFLSFSFFKNDAYFYHSLFAPIIPFLSIPSS